MVDARVGEGHPPSLLLGDVIGDDEAGFVLESGCVGEEGGGMAVFADAQHDEVK